MYVIRRSSHNPLIAPVSDKQWAARATFNPSPVKKGSITHLLYRALGRPDALMTPAGVSTIGKALTIDGKHFQNQRQFIIPSVEWDKYGCEDPRATFFEGKYYIFYTALGGMPFSAGNIKVGVAVSSDLETVEEKHLITPFNAKAAALFPERINGKITLILTAHTDEPPAKIAVAQCDAIEELWDPEFWKKWHQEIDTHTINPLRFPNDHVEVGSAPLKTKEGWLLFYSYIQNYFGGGDRVFGIEAMLLQLDDPLVIAGKSKGPIMVPEEIYEKYGMVPDIVFPTGALLDKSGRVDLYYGAADTVCARASLNLDDLLNALLPERRVELIKRAKENPVLVPSAQAWENKAVFNPGAIDIGGTIYLLYRAQGEDGVSRIGLALSKNGVKITERLTHPVYGPREGFESRGCEDPRLTRIGQTIYMVYTAFDGVSPWRAALTSISVKDFVARKWDKWAPPQLITPDPVQDKDTCLLAEKIGGQYMVMHRIDPLLCADFLDTLDFKKSRLTRCIEIMGPRPGVWDSKKIGIAGPPTKTKKGWLLIYHGVSKTGTYRLGAVLLDLKNPAVILSRTVDTIFEPTEQYEKEGQVKNAVFSCGSVVRGDTLFIYYGGADTVVGVATVSMKKLLKILCPTISPDMTSIPRAMVFDLDGTLAESKQRVTQEMGELIGDLLRHIPVAIMSGGSRAQFEKQFFPALPGGGHLDNLYLFPTNAAACFVHRGGWKPQYDYSYSDAQRAEIHKAIEEALAEVHVPEPAEVFGARVQDRGAQITFSAVGQEAPVAAKEAWAKEHDAQRHELRRVLAHKLPNYSVSTGGITSIDITPKSINKAYGVKRFAGLTHITIAEMLYVGDALGEGGNDSVVIETGIPTHPVFGPEETAALIKNVISRLITV